MNYYLIDNGESYSDHTIYFVKTKWGPKLIEGLLKALIDKHWNCSMTIEAHFTQEPLSGKSTWGDIECFLWPSLLFNSGDLTEAAKELPRDFLREILQDYVKENPRGSAAEALATLESMQ